MCGDTAVYARPGDAADFADRIIELLDDPARAAQLGAAARARAVPALLWPQQVPALLTAVDGAIRLRREAP